MQLKRILFLLFFFFLFSELNAQFAEKNALYLTEGFDAGNYWGGHIGLNYVHNNKYSLQFGTSVLMRKAKSVPDDYSTGLIDGLFSLGFASLHFDEMENYQFLAGRIFGPKTGRTTRFHLAAGLAYTLISEPTNWQYAGGGGWTSNYTHDTETHGTVSFVITPKVEFPFTRYFGVSLFSMLQVNGDRTYIGFGVEGMLGILRAKDK